MLYIDCYDLYCNATTPCKNGDIDDRIAMFSCFVKLAHFFFFSPHPYYTLCDSLRLFEICNNNTFEIKLN